MKNDIQELLNKYWAGDSSLDEEAQIKSYFQSDNVDKQFEELAPLFVHLKAESNKSYGFEPDLSFVYNKPKAKIKYLIPKLLTIAASFVLLFSVAITSFNSSDTSYKNKYTEVQDPEEALEIAKEALGFLGNKYEKGTSPMTKHIKNLERTAVFKYN